MSPMWVHETHKFACHFALSFLWTSVKVHWKSVVAFLQGPEVMKCRLVAFWWFAIDSLFAASRTFLEGNYHCHLILKWSQLVFRAELEWSVRDWAPPCMLEVQAFSGKWKRSICFRPDVRGSEWIPLWKWWDSEEREAVRPGPFWSAWSPLAS